MRSYLILGMCGLFLIQYFAHSPWLGTISVVAALIAFFASLAKANPAPRWFGISMLSVGILIEFQKGGGIEGVSQGISMNLPLITLVVLVPLLSLPLKLSGFLEAINALLHHLKDHPRKLFGGITGVFFVLSPILNIGTVRIVDDLLKNLRLSPLMVAKSYSVGFSATIIWSPYYASVALVLYYLGMRVGEYIFYGLSMSLAFLVTGNVLFALWSKRRPLSIEEVQAAEHDDGDYKRKLLYLGFFVAGLVCTTFLLEYLTHWSMLVIVSLLAITLPVCWAIATKGWNRLVPHLLDFRDKSVPLMNNEIVLFISAGLLGNSLQGTSIGNGIQLLMIQLADQSFALFAFAIVATVVTVTFIGIHPMVIITALVTQMNPEQLHTTNQALAMLLLLSWSISSVLSPVNPLNLLVSRLSGISGLETGVRANGIHLIAVAALGIIIITMIH